MGAALLVAARDGECPILLSGADGDGGDVEGSVAKTVRLHKILMQQMTPQPN